MVCRRSPGYENEVNGLEFDVLIQHEMADISKILVVNWHKL